MPGLWRVSPGQQLAQLGWQDEFVVYNNLTGDTHLIDNDALALLTELRQGPASIAGLVLAFAPDLPLEDRAALPATLHTMLDSLHQLFLIEPC